MYFLKKLSFFIIIIIIFSPFDVFALSQNIAPYCNNMRTCNTRPLSKNRLFFQTDVMNKTRYIPFRYIDVQKKNMFDIIDNNVSFINIKNILNTVFAYDTINKKVVSGRDILVYILKDKSYNPYNSIESNEKLFDYIFNRFDLFYNKKTKLYDNEKRKTFLITLANGLYNEYHDIYPWKLKNYSQYEIDRLFIYAVELDYKDNLVPKEINNTIFHTYENYDVTINAHYKQNKIARKIVKNAQTQKEAIMNIIQWYQRNFFHANENYTWDKYLDGDLPKENYLPVPKSIERIYEERIVGCHEPTTMIAGMLHAINIPVLELSLFGHGVLYFPTLDRYVHGDHIAISSYYDDSILFTTDEYNAYASMNDEIASWKNSFLILYEKFNNIPFYFSKYRKNKSLYIDIGYKTNVGNVCTILTSEDMDFIQNIFPEYSISNQMLNACIQKISSPPIQTLYQLSI